MGRRPVPDAHPLRRAPRLQGRAAVDRRGRLTPSRSRATAPTRCSSSRAARTACSACRRPSPRAASTPRRRPSRCCPRPRTSRSRSTRTTCRSTSTAAPGPGGQSVNTTDSAVRITHKPTGIVVSMQDEKSQLQNRERAMRVLRARLYERALAEQQAELGASRQAQVGTGERAEKIRTYNYGERRVKDHRINLLVHNLDAILMGELDELTAALQDDEKRRRLEEQAEWPDGLRRRARSAARTAAARRRAAASAARLAAAGCDTPRLDAELLLAAALGVRPRAAGASTATTTLSAGARHAFDGAAGPPRGARAGGLHPRPPRFRQLELDGRPARADPAAGDRAAGRGRRSSCPPARGCSTSAPAAARSRWRSSDERPDLQVRGSDVERRGAGGGARPTRARLGLDVELRVRRPARRPSPATPCWPTCPTWPRARRWRPRSRAMSRPGRCSPGPTGSTSIRRLIATGGRARPGAGAGRARARARAGGGGGGAAARGRLRARSSVQRDLAGHERVSVGSVRGA